MATAADLKAELGPLLIAADRVQPRMGLRTGWTALDEYLIWQGLPKGALSLFVGLSGLGATTLWAQAAAQVTAKKQWCAWISAGDIGLCPWALRKLGVDFRHFMVVGPPRDGEQLLWALQEIISLSLFELIGCDLGEVRLRGHQFVKLRQLAQRAGVAVVILSPRPFPNATTNFPLILEFSAGGVRLARALHRPTPFVLPRRDTYADLMPLLTQGRAPGHRRNLSDL